MCQRQAKSKTIQTCQCPRQAQANDRVWMGQPQVAIQAVRRAEVQVGMVLVVRPDQRSQGLSSFFARAVGRQEFPLVGEYSSRTRRWVVVAGYWATVGTRLARSESVAASSEWQVWCSRLFQHYCERAQSPARYLRS